MKFICSKLSCLLVLGCLFTASSPASASTSQLGMVGNIISENWGVVVFNQYGARSTAPSCQGSNVPTAWAIDVTTPGGQMMMSFLMSNYSAAKRVYVVGTGTCPAGQSNAEQVSYMGTQDAALFGVGGAVNGAQVIQVLPSASILTFVLSISATNGPACGAGQPNRFSIDESTPTGQTMAAGIMTAFAQGDTVDVFGTGICNPAQGNEEQAYYLQIHSAGH